eukprot:scaffold17477_cov41-Cyclotella_meneghiniana.AAC.10
MGKKWCPSHHEFSSLVMQSGLEKREIVVIPPTLCVGLLTRLLEQWGFKKLELISSSSIHFGVLGLVFVV